MDFLCSDEGVVAARILQALLGLALIALAAFALVVPVQEGRDAKLKGREDGTWPAS
jgi:hypothetical protein